MKERLQKILSARGVCSRREAERMISDGRVWVDGIAASLGDSADPDEQEICIDGVPLPRQEKLIYIMLNKPRGYITTMKDDRGRKTVAELVSDCPARVYPVGRLDFDSEGLLLMTNDGELANAVMHPSKGIQKTYMVNVAGNAAAAVEALRLPIDVDGVTVTAKKVELVSCKDDKGTLHITIGEGRKRQVRKMCAKCGLTVLRLVRISEGGLKLGDLKSGAWRYLTDQEVETLWKKMQ